MFDFEIAAQYFDLFFVMCFIILILSTLVIVPSLIYDVFCNKTPLRTWFLERKYLFIAYLFGFLIVCIWTCALAFGFLGMLATIPALLIAIVVVTKLRLKKDLVQHLWLPTDKKCSCGHSIVRVVQIHPSGKQKFMYYTCVSCRNTYKFEAAKQ